MKISSAGLSIIKEFEGFRAQAYKPIPSDPWTIGYGTTRGVKPGDVMTRAEAEHRLRQELVEYERAVERATGGNATQPQFDALVSFAYNVGVKGMAGSTVIKRHNSGDHQSAARAFGLWNKAGGKTWPGLTRRRAAEAALYLTPEIVSTPLPVAEEVREAAAADEMPRAVEPERSMAESQINRAGVIAGGTAAVATVAETARTVADVKTSADMMGEWLVPILLVAVVGLCAYIVWQRYKQRNGGWA